MSMSITLSPDKAMAEYAIEAVHRLRAWVRLHLERGGRFRISAQNLDVLRQVDDAADDLEDAVAADGAMSSEITRRAADNVSEAIWAAREAADKATRGMRGSPAWQHARELEDGPLRRLLGVFRGVQEMRDMAGAGEIEPLHAQIVACEMLVDAEPDPSPLGIGR